MQTRGPEFLNPPPPPQLQGGAASIQPCCKRGWPRVQGRPDRVQTPNIVISLSMSPQKPTDKGYLATHKGHLATHKGYLATKIHGFVTVCVYLGPPIWSVSVWFPRPTKGDEFEHMKAEFDWAEHEEDETGAFGGLTLRGFVETRRRERDADLGPSFLGGCSHHRREQQASARIVSIGQEISSGPALH